VCSICLFSASGYCNWCCHRLVLHFKSDQADL
ncbi:hypothetical protein AVDCRST_MAG81-3636, partial [uncultured Synechococcales cyanobacterium]